jgi:hypothetical protein
MTKKAIIFYNNIQNLDPLVEERIRDLSNFYNGAVINDPTWVTIESADLHATLNQLADEGYQFVIVVADGNCIRDGGIDDYIITQCNQSGCPLIGHIILHPNDIVKLDEQFFCLNLTVWHEIGRPRFESHETRLNGTYQGCSRSSDNYHDDYTPYFIYPSNEEQVYEYGYHPFGTEVILLLLNAGYTISNVNSVLRKKKLFLYPQHNQKELLSLFTDFDTQVESVPLQQFQTVIKKQRDISDKTVYILNSERIAGHDGPTIDHFVGVCGGLKPPIILGMNGTVTAKVSLFDFSDIALVFQKHIRDVWDGDLYHYKDICDEFQQQHPDNVLAWKSWNTWDYEVNYFLNSAGISFNDFKDYWQKYQSLDVTFTKVNILEPTSWFIDAINGSSCYYVWISNVFNMEYTTALHGRKFLESRFKEFQENLFSLTGNVYLEKECMITKLK